ncbi:MAG: nuclear transport factor 2 family protein [Bryobacteraceae bacterium]
MTPVQLVQDILGAYGRGDTSAVLEALAPDVEWSNATVPGLPHSAPRQGREQVAEYLRQSAEAIEMLHFEPKEFVVEGGNVVAIGWFEARLRRTGRTARTDFAMWWHISAGKVLRYQAFMDTAALAALAEQPAGAGA